MAGCSAAPSPSASASWVRGQVEQPSQVTDQPSSSTKYCAPCHPSLITQMRDVAVTADAFVAVGSQTDAALAWTSSDGTSWTIASLPDAAGAALNAVASDQRVVVAAGRARGKVAAWFRNGSGAWQVADLPAEPGAITAIVAGGTGFLAGGYLGPEFGPAAAAFWRSDDGSSWTRVADQPSLDDGRVRAIARTDGGGFLAVGHRGSPGSDDVDAVSWTSADGSAWQRAPAEPALSDALMQSVVAWHGRFVAVGTTEAGDLATAWTSTDGLDWQPAPDAPALHSNSPYAPHAEMSDVLAAGDRLLAVGWNSSPSNGSAVTWSSADGAAWVRAPDEPSLSGGGMAAAAARDGLVIAVGSTGWPDTHAATAWRHTLD